MDVIILAGGDIGELGLDRCPEGIRALLRLNGRPMLTYIVDVFHECQQIDKIYIVGDCEILAPFYADYEDVVLLAAKDNLIDNAVTGIKLCQGPVIIASADTPLINAQVLEKFIAACNQFPGNDLYYPLVSKEVNDKAFPGTKRTYFKFTDAEVTGGNIFVFNASMPPDQMEKAAELGKGFTDVRKSKVKIILPVGIVFLVKMAFGKVTLQEAEEKVSKFLGLKGKIIPFDHPEIALDVDKESDLKAAEEYLISKT